MRLIGQVDDKFIMFGLEKHNLIAMDQHAAHERVRLEYLIIIINCIQFPKREKYK